MVYSGTHALTYELVGDIVMIGRAPVNDIVIDNPVVSARHAMLLKVGDSYWLKDLNSTNGTHINGLLFTYGELKDGDTIRFASVVAIFAERSENGGQPARLERSGRVPQQDENPPGTQRKWIDDSSKEKVGRVDHVSLQHQMTHDLAIQEAKEARSARKAVGERLLAYLDKEMGTCGRTTSRSALNFWRNKIRKHEAPLTARAERVLVRRDAFRQIFTRARETSTTLSPWSPREREAV
jgi:pSer/pThr/pTyr-binding forkhead associated (FHA) protein